jgi:hypothetical protein
MKYKLYWLLCPHDIPYFDNQYNIVFEQDHSTGRNVATISGDLATYLKLKYPDLRLYEVSDEV